jgi:hypothetical protein
LTSTIIFKRNGQNIIAKIFKTTIEPLDTGNGKQVVFFCQDANGRRYRVPKSEVLILGKQSKLKEKKTKKKARKIA